jgi:hypothetical protein
LITIIFCNYNNYSYFCLRNVIKINIVMKEEFYFVLYCDSLVANTYVGSRSNAKAYFKRWVRKHFPCYEDYYFIVYRYSSMSDMLHDVRYLSSYVLSVAD